MLRADMAGQLMVRGVEADVTALAARRTPSFLDMPFEEAIRLFRERRILSADEFYALSDLYRTRAFTATRLLTETLRERAYDELVRALEQGSTFEEFAAGVEDEATSPLSQGYLENVFRTNVQQAYGAGRFRQLTHPDVIAARPYVEYRTARDSRVRPDHAELEGKQWRADDEAWHRVAPPNGFQCRCAIVSLSAEDLDQEQLRRRVDVEPDEGFAAPPTALVEREL